MVNLTPVQQKLEEVAQMEYQQVQNTESVCLSGQLSSGTISRHSVRLHAGHRID